MSKRIRIRTKKPWIGYPGTPVQQNYAETLEHGFLLWDIQDRQRFDVSFCPLPNPKPYVTVEWSGDVARTLKVAHKHPAGSRFRIRSKELLSQKDVTHLTHQLQQELKATEVTFKNEHQANREVISAGAATLVKDDLRNPDVLVKLLKDYHKSANVTEAEWQAVRDQVAAYLAQALGTDDIVRNTKWSLQHLAFDNVFAYGSKNSINFDQLPGIVGIFGPNRAGKSSIVGTIMYSLFNMTDRGSVKNLHIINVRHPYCYTKAIIAVNGTRYVIERQTVKHENRYGQFHATTQLNVFRVEDNGELVDLAGEERKDTERVIRKLVGSGDDALLTSVAVQDDVKQYINQGSTRRRQVLSRFLDLDIFDRMFSLAKDDVNASKGVLRNLPDRDWSQLEEEHANKLATYNQAIKEKDHLLHDASVRLDDLRRQLLSFKDFVPVTQTQVEQQSERVTSLSSKRTSVSKQIQTISEEDERQAKKIASAQQVLADYDLPELRRRLEAYRTLEASLDALRHVYEKDAERLKQQERSLKILDDVPCGDSFPTCKFIKDAHKNKDKVEPQREKVQRALEKLQKAESALVDLRSEDLSGKVAKIEQLMEMTSKLQVARSSKQIELHKLETSLVEVSSSLTSAEQKLKELEEALKNEENAEVVALRHSIDTVQRQVRGLDAEKLKLASEVGKVQSDMEKMAEDRSRREQLLQLMKAHELIANGFSKRGIPSLIIASQLPVINAEVAKILHGIVDFNIELEVDDDSDSMEVYIDYGDSRRPIELGSGMEKMIASLAIRVAMVNVSSLPRLDTFIIDESFGALDPSSVEACNRLLLSLKRYFRTVIIITHVEGVKDVADHVLEITKVEKDSHVMYSEAWPGDRTSGTD
jgi:DNA repair exonuclease SbcCD ATPase subunit